MTLTVVSRLHRHASPDSTYKVETVQPRMFPDTVPGLFSVTRRSAIFIPLTAGRSLRRGCTGVGLDSIHYRPQHSTSNGPAYGQRRVPHGSPGQSARKEHESLFDRRLLGGATDREIQPRLSRQPS
jgi:hypothetical protein